MKQPSKHNESKDSNPSILLEICLVVFGWGETFKSAMKMCLIVFGGAKPSKTLLSRRFSWNFFDPVKDLKKTFVRALPRVNCARDRDRATPKGAPKNHELLYSTLLYSTLLCSTLLYATLSMYLSIVSTYLSRLPSYPSK